MDPVRNTEQFREMRIKALMQEIRIIAVVEENETGTDDGPVVEKQIIVDSLQRPLPVPYNESQ
jgi:hypothetical protein